jgi:hypothetical protein
MRFLNSQTCEFQEVAEPDLQPMSDGYAILSHRWGHDEVTFDDVISQSDIKEKLGGLK